MGVLSRAHLPSLAYKCKLPLLLAVPGVLQMTGQSRLSSDIPSEYMTAYLNDLHPYVNSDISRTLIEPNETSRNTTGPILWPFNRIFFVLFSRTHDYLFSLAEFCDDVSRETKGLAHKFRRRKCEPLKPTISTEPKSTIESLF